MRVVLAGLFLAGLSGAALAQGTWHLDRVIIKGSRSVPASQLYPVLREQPGSAVTKDEILADRDALTDYLQKQHVTGSVNPALVDKHNGHVDVVFNIEDNGIQQPTTVTVAPTLAAQNFVGNRKIDTATLEAATGLKPGDKLSAQMLQDAEQKIGAVYKQKNIGVQINPQVQQPPGGAVTVTWNITESKKKMKRNTEDLGGYSTDQ